MNKFTEMAKLEPPSVETVKSIAKHLMMYLRWIEHLQSEGKAIHEIHFPELEESRVTWTYYRYLKRLLRQTNQPISLGVAKARMQAVVNFYKGLLAWNLILKSTLENEPYNSTLAGIPVINSAGIQCIKTIEITNFTFRVPKRSHIGEIKDGGRLRPLTEEEQTLILNQLKQSGNQAFILMCLVALFTGARIQTVCTIRVKDIYYLHSNTSAEGEVLLLVGKGTGVDSKNQKRYRIHFPVALVRMLRDYIESEEHLERRALSFYRESNENYVFLTSNGSPYYTSTSEISDRQRGMFSQRISAKDRVSFPIQKGNAVRNYIIRLVRDIQVIHPDFILFRFHDLRATFGMNFIRDADALGIKDVRAELKARMGHSNFDTTQGYLDFDKSNAAAKAAIAFHHERINRTFPRLQS
ncbi:MAG: site-specific integrase [Zhongshania sp.]|uniref:site-specific integrase n=1 Tax=Zhongshania sp. TaxID=1971902 RepID=UPI00261A8599|nr:site-specific integrase [Zhongshania sp.]MDF1694113.1 site-specific integrase [Zhongshania sp.]